MRVDITKNEIRLKDMMEELASNFLLELLMLRIKAVKALPWSEESRDKLIEIILAETT